MIKFKNADGIDFSLLNKYPSIARAMTIAAAGKHNFMLIGNDDVKDKIMLMMEYLTPSLTEEESEILDRIKDVANWNTENKSEFGEFITPSHLDNLEHFCGGGPKAQPGYISLAHKGVLYLCNASEYRSSCLQMLRVPLESKAIVLSRAGRHTTYPADFQLLTTTASCPCGNYQVSDKLCLCSSKSIKFYWNKIESLLTKIQIKMLVSPEENVQEFSLEDARRKIATAIEIQRERGVYNNNISSSKQSLKHQPIADIFRIAKTIADIEEREVELKDIEEAESLINFPLDLSEVIGSL